MSQSIAQPTVSFTDSQILLSLIRREWRQCRGTVTSLAMLWVIGLWVLVMFHHPAWLLLIGVLHVVLVSPTQAGSDVLDGCEEFSFSQPPGRGTLYLARLIPGMVFLLASGIIGGLAIVWNLPQALWSLCFSGGLTEPFAPNAGFLWYGLAVLAPTAAHAVTFALAANSGTRAAVSSSWLVGIAAAGAVIALGMYLEAFLWQNPNGFLILPCLLAVTVLVPLAGHQFYLRKEATGSGGTVASDGGRGGFWIVAVIVGLLLFMLLSVYFLRLSRVSSMQQQDHRARAIQQEERSRTIEQEERSRVIQQEERSRPVDQSTIPLAPSATPERGSN